MALSQPQEPAQAAQSSHSLLIAADAAPSQPHWQPFTGQLRQVQRSFVWSFIGSSFCEWVDDDRILSAGAARGLNESTDFLERRR